MEKNGLIMLKCFFFKQKKKKNEADKRKDESTASLGNSWVAEALKFKRTVPKFEMVPLTLKNAFEKCEILNFSPSSCFEEESSRPKSLASRMF